MTLKLKNKFIPKIMSETRTKSHHGYNILIEWLLAPVFHNFIVTYISQNTFLDYCICNMYLINIIFEIKKNTCLEFFSALAIHERGKCSQFMLVWTTSSQLINRSLEVL